MVFATGDCRGNFQRFGMRHFPGQKAMDRSDYIIICGDFGFWSDTPEDEYWLNWLEGKPFTILLIIALGRLLLGWRSRASLPLLENPDGTERRLISCSPMKNILDECCFKKLLAPVWFK